MIKRLILFLCATTIAHALTTTIKNDTKVTYFITCDQLGYLLEPIQEVTIEVPETSWIASWWRDPSIITLFKKVGDGKEFVEVFLVRPKACDDDEILILLSEVQRKARNVTAPFTVTTISGMK